MAGGEWVDNGMQHWDSVGRRGSLFPRVRDWGRGRQPQRSRVSGLGLATSCVLCGSSQSQGDETHGLQEGQAEQEQQHPRGVLCQQVYAPTLD